MGILYGNVNIVTKNLKTKMNVQNMKRCTSCLERVSVILVEELVIILLIVMLEHMLTDILFDL